MWWSGHDPADACAHAAWLSMMVVVVLLLVAWLLAWIRAAGGHAWIGAEGFQEELGAAWSADAWLGLGGRRAAADGDMDRGGARAADDLRYARRLARVGFRARRHDLAVAEREGHVAAGGAPRTFVAGSHCAGVAGLARLGLGRLGAYDVRSVAHGWGRARCVALDGSWAGWRRCRRGAAGFRRLVPKASELRNYLVGGHT